MNFPNLASRDFYINHQMAERLSEIDYDLVIGIGRSGIPLAITIHEYQKNAGIMYANIASYDDDNKQGDIEFSQSFWDEIKLRLHKSLGKILVVDGIVDSGKTAMTIAAWIRKAEWALSNDHNLAEIHLACNHMNSSTYPIVSEFYTAATFWQFKEDDEWVIQAHEKEAIENWI